MDKFLSRKFILSLLSLMSATYLIVGGYIQEGVYSAIVLGTVAAYITGNVAQKLDMKQGGK